MHLIGKFMRQALYSYFVFLKVDIQKLTSIARLSQNIIL